MGVTKLLEPRQDSGGRCPRVRRDCCGPGPPRPSPPPVTTPRPPDETIKNGQKLNPPYLVLRSKPPGVVGFAVKGHPLQRNGPWIPKSHHQLSCGLVGPPVITLPNQTPHKCGGTRAESVDLPDARLRLFKSTRVLDSTVTSSEALELGVVSFWDSLLLSLPHCDSRYGGGLSSVAPSDQLTWSLCKAHIPPNVVCC